MANLNRVDLIGSLGADPEKRFAQNGTVVVNASLAVNEFWNDKQTGEKQSKAEWIRLVAFGKLAENFDAFCCKGSSVYVCGRIQTRDWEDKEGIKRYTTEIVVNFWQLLKNGKTAAEDETKARSVNQGEDYQPPINDDDLPF